LAAEIVDGKFSGVPGLLRVSPVFTVFTQARKMAIAGPKSGLFPDERSFSLNP
jgi:hypothetical protein